MLRCASGVLRCSLPDALEFLALFLKYIYFKCLERISIEFSFVAVVVRERSVKELKLKNKNLQLTA